MKRDRFYLAAASLTDALLTSRRKAHKRLAETLISYELLLDAAAW